MFLLMILAIMAVLLIAIAIGGISVLGTVGIVIFGDVIVCAGVISLIIYFIIRKRRK